MKRLNKIKVKNFTDYRSYLLACIQEAKDRDEKWTLGRFAMQLGLRSTSSISKVVSGDRLPGPKMISKLGEYFSFTQKEALYFEDLVKFHKVKKEPHLSMAILERIGREHAGGVRKLLDNDTYIILANWYGLAVREMLRTDAFLQDPQWLSKNFHFNVSSKDITEAISCLKSCGLVSLNSEGLYEVTSQGIYTESDICREALKSYHESSIDLAKQSIRRIPMEEREIQATTMLMDKEDLGRAKTFIRKFRSEFVKHFESKNAKKVYQFQLQLFPLTKDLD